MELYLKSEVVTTTYYLILTQEEAQTLYDICGNIGGQSTNSDGSTAPRGHIDELLKALESQFGFNSKHKTSGSIYIGN
jgi:hypothetical protein